MRLIFAPIQGYTDWVYRRVHRETVGGVDEYVTPFVRCDRGEMRNRDLRDIDTKNNEGVEVVPQVIVADGEEARMLIDKMQENGYGRIDINMGCPFPLQVAKGRGAALLCRPERVEEIMGEVSRRKGLRASVKMRSGMDSEEEGRRVVELLDGYDLEYITIHPRTGRQQYKGEPDWEAFGRLSGMSRHKVVYNGDVTTTEQIGRMASEMPSLYGIMIGRGLLARPTLAREWRDGVRMSDEEVLRASMAMHRKIYDMSCRMLQGEQQVLLRMRAFWEYQEPLVDKKVYKRLMKCGNLKNYEEAVRSLM